MDIKNEIKPEDVCWDMDWDQTKYPDKPVKEPIFEREMALAHLIMNEVIFLSTNWYMKDWPEEAKKTTVLCVNCSDVFAWGCCDDEHITPDEIEELYGYWLKDPMHGPSIWCMKKRKELPQKPVYEMIKKAGIWDLDSMGLEENYYDAFWRKKSEEDQKTKESSVLSDSKEIKT